MKGTKEVPDGWILSYKEVYKVSLKADYGSVIELVGSNFENILARCVESAKELDKQFRLM